MFGLSFFACTGRTYGEFELDLFKALECNNNGVPRQFLAFP
jgi:hypothetical protein